MSFRSVIALVAAVAACAHAEPLNPRIATRYKQMLEAKPEEGIALDRLWKAAVESGGTNDLIAEYRGQRTFAGRMILGHLLRRAGREEEAIAAFNEAAAYDPANPLPALALARLEFNRNRTGKAVTWFEKAAALLPPADPRRPDLLFELGSAWLAAGDTKKAADAWEKTVALTPQNLELRRRLAQAYARHYLNEPALRHFQYLVDHAPPSERATALQEIARLHSAAGRPGQALETLERAVSLTAPGSWLRSDLLGQIVRLAQRQHATAELEAKWKTHAEQHPRDVGAALQLLEFYERTGHLEPQAAWLEKLSTMLPRQPDYRLKLARVLVQLDRLDDAATHYDRLLAEQPSNSDLVFERARLDLQRDLASAARARLAALLQQNPADESLRQKALAFYEEHRLLDLVEDHLKADAASNRDEPLFALAKFYFSHGQKDAGRATLQRLINPQDPPERRAALHARIAETLKAHGEFQPALAAVDSALALQPNHRELHLLRGDLQSALAHYDAARQSYTRAYALGSDAAQRLEADAKLFETFRAESPNFDPAQDANPPSVTMAARVAGFIWELMRVATERKDAESWLRVARWKAWNGDRASAVTFAVKASDLDPKNLAPREFLAKLASNHGDAALAITHLRELAELNPAQRPAYLREIAQLELQRGRPREAQAILESLAVAHPGSPDYLAALANAQERAGDLHNALASWRKTLELSPAHQQQEARTSILRVLQQLNQHEEAARWLLQAVDAASEADEKSRRFDELLLHAKQHGLLGWLRGLFEERRKARADDYFTAVALGRVLKLAGEKEAAFDLFAEAVYAATKPAEALPELIQEAQDLRRLDVAVRLQEELTRVGRQNQPDNLLKLATLQLKLGDLDGAERTWTRAVGKFPRDVEVIRQAAEFHLQWGDPERLHVLLRKLTALDPSDLHAALQLGEVEFAAGRFAEARHALESVMKLTPPVAHLFYPAATPHSPWTEKGLFAGTSRASRPPRHRVFLAVPWRTVPENLKIEPAADAETRLRALSLLGRIAALDRADGRRPWIDDWNATLASNPAEAIWALYFAGAEDSVLNEIARRIAREPQIQGHRQAFIWLCLESGRFSRLHAWLASDEPGPKDMESFATAFARWSDTNPALLTRQALDALFPNGKAPRLWSSALELARQRRFNDAVVLAQRLWAAQPGRRADIGRELAHWYLALGQLAECRRVLRAVAALPADSLDAPPYLALWELWQLLDEPERPRLLEEMRSAHPGPGVQALMTRLVCDILARDEAAARASLTALIARRPLGPPAAEDQNSATRIWHFLLSLQRQLIAWDQLDLAAYLGEHLFADEGLLAWWRMQKIQERVQGANLPLWSMRPVVADEELRARQLVDMLAFLRGGATERERMLSAMHHRGPELLERFASVLQTHGAHADAASVFQRAWETDRTNAGLLVKALDAAKLAGDVGRSEALRREVVQEKLNPANDTSPREFALEWADLLEQRGAIAEALHIVTDAGKHGDDLRPLLRQAEFLERLGRYKEANAVWSRLVQSQSGNVYARNTLALRLEEKGRTADALAVRTAVDPQAPLLFLKLGRPNDAVAALERLSGSQAVYAAMSLAEMFGLRANGHAARSVLISTASRITDPRSQLQLQTKLLTIPGFPPSPHFAERTRRRLETLVADQPQLLASYYRFFEEHAATLGIAEAWSEALRAEWSEGRGTLMAGVALFRRQLVLGERVQAAATLERILGYADLSAEILAELERVTARANDSELRLQIAALKARRGWPEAEATFDYIRLLDQLGKREAARTTLAGHEWLAAYDGGAELIGRAWLDLGDPERARKFYQAALSKDQLLPSASEYAGMARVQIAARRFEAARLLLHRAFALPSCRDYDALIEYLAAHGDLSRWREAAGEFHISPAGRHDLAVELFEHFAQTGRVTDALAHLAENPTIVIPLRRKSEGLNGVTLAEVRALVRKAGAFAEGAQVLDLLAANGFREARAERAGLDADRAVAGNESASPHLHRAAELLPTSWEFTNRLAAAQAAQGDRLAARKTFERFLELSTDSRDRQAALAAWGNLREPPVPK